MIGRLLSRLRRDTRGATLIEFAILAPAMFTMLVGVLQIGLGMQAYNSLRGIASDTARYATTAYQTDNDVDAGVIANQGRTLATQPPYGLKLDNLDLDVTEEASPRVTGTREFTIEVTYYLPSILAFVGLDTIPITYTRPIFVVGS